MTFESETLPDLRKIAVLRAGGIGDLVLSLPAFEALRAAYPDAEIVLLGTPAYEELLAGRPAPVDRVVAVPPSQGIRAGGDATPAEQNGFFASMERERFDLAIQLHGGGRYSNPLVQKLGAAATIGLRESGAAPLDRTVPYVYWEHETLRCLEVVALAGARPVTVTPRLDVTKSDVAEANAAIGSVGRALVVLHPGAGDVRRRWPVAKFAHVGDELARGGATVVVIGSGDDEEVADDLVSAMDEPALGLAGRLTLRGLLGLLSVSALVVGNDSGPRHLAEAVGTPTVAVYWCGNLVNASPLTRSRHRPFPAWTVSCPVCGSFAASDRGRGCAHEVSFVSNVQTEPVLKAALELLASPAPNSEPLLA